MAMQGQAPQMMPPQAMAAYGMQLGGYDMPFVMANGGLPRAQEGKTYSTTITDKETLGKEYAKGTYTPGKKQEGVTYYDVEGQPTIKGRGYAEGEVREWDESNITRGGSWNPTIDQAVDQYCKNMQNPKSKAFHNVPAAQVAAANFGYLKNSSDPEKQAQYADIVKRLEKCSNAAFEFITVDEDVKEEVCFCEDKEGNKIPGTEMTPAQIEADGKIEGYTADQGCVSEFINAYCQEEVTEVTEVKREAAVQEREDAALPAIPISSMRRDVADPEMASLAPLMSGERNYLDYRTAVQNLQSTGEKQKQAIINAPGLTFGQKQAAMAKVDAEIAPRIASTVTDVYNKNVATANQLAKTEEARDMQYNLSRANIQQRYLDSLQQSDKERIANINANRQRKDDYKKNQLEMQFMAKAIGSENVDAFGNFIGSNRTMSRYSTLSQCLAANPNNQAACFKEFALREGQNNNQQNNDQQKDLSDNQEVQARFGGKLLPYVYGSSVYPF